MVEVILLFLLLLLLLLLLLVLLALLQLLQWLQGLQAKVCYWSSTLQLIHRAAHHPHWQEAAMVACCNRHLV